MNTQSELTPVQIEQLKKESLHYALGCSEQLRPLASQLLNEYIGGEGLKPDFNAEINRKTIIELSEIIRQLRGKVLTQSAPAAANPQDNNQLTVKREPR